MVVASIVALIVVTNLYAKNNAISGIDAHGSARDS